MGFCSCVVSSYLESSFNSFQEKKNQLMLESTKGGRDRIPPTPQAE